MGSRTPMVPTTWKPSVFVDETWSTHDGLLSGLKKEGHLTPAVTWCHTEKDAGRRRTNPTAFCFREGPGVIRSTVMGARGWGRERRRVSIWEGEAVLQTDGGHGLRIPWVS